MKKLTTIIKRLESVKDLEWLLKTAFKDPSFKQLIISLNTHDQLFDHGIDSKGRSLGDYSPVSVEKYGKRPGHIQLFEHGDFYESFRAFLVGTNIKITAITLKGEISFVREFDTNTQNVKSRKVGETDLLAVYGKDILGLTDENLQIVINKAREILVPAIKKYLLAA